MKTIPFVAYFSLGVIGLVSISIFGFNFFNGLGVFLSAIFAGEALVAKK